MTKHTLTIGLVALLLGLSGGALGTYSWFRDTVAIDDEHNHEDDDHHEDDGHHDHDEGGDHDDHGGGGHDDHDDDFEQGSHGGRLLTQGDLAIEVTIYEQGIPPQFRVYAFNNGTPIAPGILGSMEGKVD